MMRKRQGFTLVELIVVLGLLSIATSLAVSTFMVMNDNWDTVRTGAEFDERASKLFEAIRRDTETALSTELASVAIEHEDRIHQSSDSVFFRIAFDNDAITMPVFAQVGAQRNLVAAKVRYSIVRGTRTASLMRQTTGIDGEFEGEGISISEGIVALDIQFPAPNGYGWTPRWNRPGTPSMIRVNVLMIDENDPTEQATRSAVLRIHS